MISEQKEKTILRISFIAGLLFAIVEFIFSIYSHSQSSLTDAVYDGSELIFIGLILYLTPLFHKPVSEKYPYGFYQVESIFIIIKGFMMMAVTVSVSAEIIESALAGGNPVNELEVSLFQFVLGLVSVVIYFIMRRINKDLSSPTVDAEILGWKLDIAYSIGLSVAFFGASFLARTPLAPIAPYFDQLLAVLIMLGMLPENIKMLWNAIKDVFLFSPDPEIVDQIKSISTEIMERYHMHPVFFDITRTGRQMWASAYFEIDEPSMVLMKLKRATDEVNDAVREYFDNCTCELLLVPTPAPEVTYFPYPDDEDAEDEVRD